MQRMRLAVGIATKGRAAILTETLRVLNQQSRLPDRVVICPASSNDVEMGSLKELSFPVEIVCGSTGLAAQRNAIIAATVDMDAIVFLDDDFFPKASYLGHAEQLLLSQSDIVVASGLLGDLIEDGGRGPGLDPAYARARLAAAPTTAVAGDFEPCFSVYGCNMVIRMTTLVATGVRFDELLPLYAWQEDTDFSRQMAPFGKIVRSASLTGIHLGTKQGRVSGVRFGYSQIANPVYLMRKGTMSVSFGSHIMARNLAGNFLRLLPPEPHIDRIGRLKGNFIAILDFMRGRLSPGRILDF